MTADFFFINGPDSAVRFDQVAAVAESDDGTIVILQCGEKVLLRITIEEFLTLAATAALGGTSQP